MFATFARRLALTLILILCAQSLLAGGMPDDPKKRTSLNKYVDAVEAYDLWKANPGKVTIIDVRSIEEYEFLGHPSMAYNIPFMFWTGKWDASRKSYSMALNPDFVQEVKALFAPGDALILMCRTGHRSAPAVGKLAEAGFTNVYNMVDGFEGDKIADTNDPGFGKRLKDGWRNTKNPWTLDLEEKLIYRQGR